VNARATSQSFVGALSATNLFWAFLGTTLGTAIGVLPGIGPALTVAVLAARDVRPRPDGRVHHVRRHLLRRDVRRLDDEHPAEHAGRDELDPPPRSTATRCAPGARAAALATAAIARSCRHAATLGLTFAAPLLASAAIEFGPRRLLALTVLAFAAVTALLGASLSARLVQLVPGIGLGLVGIDALTATRASRSAFRSSDGIDSRDPRDRLVRRRRNAAPRRATRPPPRRGAPIALTRRAG